MQHAKVAVLLSGFTALLACGKEEKACTPEDMDSEDVGDVVLLQQSLGVEREKKVTAHESRKEKPKPWAYPGEVTGEDFPVPEPEAVQFVTHLTALPDYVGQFYPQARVAIAGRGIGAAAEQIFDWLLEDIDPMCSKGPDAKLVHSCGVLIHDAKVCAQVGEHSVMFDAGPYKAERGSHNYWTANQRGVTLVTGLQNYDLLGKVLSVHDRSGVGMACGSIGPAGLKINAMVPVPGYHGPMKNVQALVLINAERGANYAAKQTLRYKLSHVDGRCSKGGSAAIANSCGIAVYSGTSCAAEPGNHLWNVSFYEDDPWKSVNYHTIKGEIGVGTVQQTAEVLTGVDLAEMVGRAVVVHDYEGASIACGILAPEVTVANGFMPPIGYTGSMQVSGWVKASISKVAPANALELAWVLHGIDERCVNPDTPLAEGACSVQIHGGGDCAADVGPVLVPGKGYEVVDGSTSEGLHAMVGKGLQVSAVLGRVVVVTDFNAQFIACGILNIADPNKPTY